MLKMLYFGHVIRTHQALEKYLILGITAGAEETGKPCIRWIENIKSVTGRSGNSIKQIVKERKMAFISVKNSQKE